MRVLVTGSSGHVGNAVATHLTKAGLEVVGLSRRPGDPAASIEHVQADIGSETVADRLSRQIRPCHGVVHAAASLEREPDAAAVPLTNCLGTQQMLKLASLWDARSFVYISGIAVIGSPRYHPITEDHPTDPPTAYHASKLFGEHLVRLATSKELAAASLQLTAPVGLGTPGGRILPVFVRRALANEPLRIAGCGTRRQNYVDVRDVATAVELCLRKSVAGLFHIASNESISNLDLARTCIRVLNSASVIEFSGEPDAEEGIVWDVSIARAAERFGYRPQFTIEDSIRSLAPGI